jgi:two-component system chemotaxis response regulator CheY
MAKTLLTIDDSKAVRDMISFTLKPEGYRVIEAENGAEGLDKLRSERPNMVITDINMPVMNGIDFILAARKDAVGRGVPIVILTTDSAPEVKKRGRDAGATGWLDKPFDSAKLIAVARKLLG